MSRKIGEVEMFSEHELDALFEVLRRRQFGGSPHRPYDGQSWTSRGAMGKRPIPKHVVTIRDFGDVVARALHDFPFEAPVDVDALCQAVCAQVARETME